MKELDGGLTPFPARPRPVGPRATAAWLSARGLYAAPTVHLGRDVGLDNDAKNPTAHLHIALDAIEWGSIRARRQDVVDPRAQRAVRSRIG